MASFYWIKLYHEILDDPKMGRLPDRAWRRCIELFLLAGDSEENGSLPPFQDIAWRLRANVDELREDMQLLAEVGILSQNGDTWHVVNFEKRQEPIPSTERVREFRKRQRVKQFEISQEWEGNEETETGNADETQGNVNGTNRYTDIDIDKNRVEEKRKDIPPSAGADAPQTPPEAPETPAESSQKAKPLPLTPGAQEFLRLFSAKRFSNAAQRDAVLELERLYPENFCACAQWAAEKGVTRGQAISMMRTALPDWGQKKKIKRGGDGRPPPDEPAGFAGLREVAEKHGLEIEGLTR